MVAGTPVGVIADFLPQFGMHGQSMPIVKKAYDEFRRVAPLMIEGDYYPLTPYNRAPNQWIAWQFHTPQTGGGVIQAFRRQESGEAVLPVSLRGLDPSARYVVRNFDTAQTRKASGQDLMSGQFTLELPTARSAGIWQYGLAESEP